MEFNSEKLESSVRRGSLSPYSVPMSLKLKLIRTFKSMDPRSFYLLAPLESLVSLIGVTCRIRGNVLSPLQKNIVKVYRTSSSPADGFFQNSCDCQEFIEDEFEEKIALNF